MVIITNFELALQHYCPDLSVTLLWTNSRNIAKVLLFLLNILKQYALFKSESFCIDHHPCYG